MNPKNTLIETIFFPLPHLSLSYFKFKISLLTFLLMLKIETNNRDVSSNKKSTYFSYAALIRAKSPTQLIILSLKCSKTLLCLSNIHFSFFLDNDGIVELFVFWSLLCACDDEPIEILLLGQRKKLN